MVELRDLNALQTTGTHYELLDAYFEKQVIEKYFFDVYQSVQTGRQDIPLFSKVMQETDYIMAYCMLKELEYRFVNDGEKDAARTIAANADSLLNHGSVESIPDYIMMDAYTETAYAAFLKDLLKYFKKYRLTFYDDRTYREENFETTPLRFRNEEPIRNRRRITAPQTEVW